MKIFGHPPDKSLLLNEPINIRDINSIDAYVCFGINSLKLLSAFPASLPAPAAGAQPSVRLAPRPAPALSD